MNKAEITELLKTDGLDVAEDMAEAAARGAIRLLRVLVPKVSVGFGFAFNMFMDGYEEQIFELIDKIDGKKG